MLREVLPYWGGGLQESLLSDLLLVLYYANLNISSALYQLLPQLKSVSEFLSDFLSSLSLDLKTVSPLILPRSSSLSL